LRDIADVNRVAGHLLTKPDRPNILINDAALPIVPESTLSPQGIGTAFATNRVGYFVLTNILLPLIERTAAAAGSARIMNISSSLHMVCQELDLSLVTSPTPTKSPSSFDSIWRYSCSKLANILFTRELARRRQKKGAATVYVNSFFPGNIPTEAIDIWKQLFGRSRVRSSKARSKSLGNRLLERRQPHYSSLPARTSKHATSRVGILCR
jgi:NAD(P)-dependent dehydrogenase (short-subunit alcohol dehydrogenase family)